MADKFQLVSYLSSLHTLLEAQSKDQHSLPSTTLAAEYNKVWAELKDLITKEQEDEARTSKQQRPEREEARTDLSRR